MPSTFHVHSQMEALIKMSSDNDIITMVPSILVEMFKKTTIIVKIAKIRNKKLIVHNLRRQF